MPRGVDCDRRSRRCLSSKVLGEFLLALEELDKVIVIFLHASDISLDARDSLIDIVVGVDDAVCVFEGGRVTYICHTG